MKKITKKIVSGLLVLSMAASLAACGGGTSITPTEAPGGSDDTQTEGETTPLADGQVEIRFSWWGGDTRHEATMKAIEAFEAQNPDIKVKAEYSAWDGWTEKVATQLVGGTAPDILQTNWNWLYQFSSDGSKFVDLRDYSDIIDFDNYAPEILADGIVADKLQGIPLGVTGKAFFWNATTFEKAGLSVPTSFAEIIEAGTVFKEVLGDDYYPMGLYEYERMLLMLYYLESKYDKPWAVDNKVNYSVEEVQDGLDWMNSLEAAHVLPSIPMLKGDGATILEKNMKWMDGRYAGMYEWDSAQAKFAQALEEGQELALGAFPTDLGVDAGLTKVNMCYSITETSQNKEAAAKLLAFLVQEEEGVLAVGLERGILANNAANEILESAGVLSDDNLTYLANKKVLEIARFGFDPNFENSALKDPSALYYEVFEGISNGVDTKEMAEYMIDAINDVYAANAY